MSSVNKHIILGNVGKDPEIRFTQDGGKIANFSVATSDRWKDKQTGEKKEQTTWHRVVCFDEKISDVIEKYVSKGSKIYLEGQVKSRKWTDNNGNEKYATETVIPKFGGTIVLLDKKEGGGVPPASDPNDYGTTKTPEYTSADYQNATSGGGRAEFDDDMPAF